MRQILMVCSFLFVGCTTADRRWTLADSTTREKEKDSLLVVASQHPAELSIADTGSAIIMPLSTGNTTPSELVSFAESLVGTPYSWASSDPKTGFDCSGFISYVFSHFHITVPRSSIDFTNVGEEIAVADAKKGDVILFTGTDPLESTVGHMGLIVSNDEEGVRFIHSTSGKEMGVTITPLNERYRKRFVAVRRIF